MVYVIIILEISLDGHYNILFFFYDMPLPFVDEEEYQLLIDKRDTTSVHAVDYCSVINNTTSSYMFG